MTSLFSFLSPLINEGLLKNYSKMKDNINHINIIKSDHRNKSIRC